MTVLVFVFGTLKQGFPNFRTNRGHRLAGVFATADTYPLYLVGDRRSPWLLDLPGEGNHVRGELFEVSADVLCDMDVLERVSDADGYVRKEITVVSQSGGSPIRAQAYLKDPALFWPLATGSIGPIVEFTLEHAALYRPRSA